MIKVIFPALLILSASACTSFEPDPEVAKRIELEQRLQAALVAEDQGIICEDVQPVGTRIAKRMCTTAEQRETAHAQGKAFVERIQTNSLLGNVQ